MPGCPIRKSLDQRLFAPTQRNRKAVHWFNPVLRKHLPTLADIAAEYCMDMRTADTHKGTFRIDQHRIDPQMFHILWSNSQTLSV